MDTELVKSKTFKTFKTFKRSKRYKRSKKKNKKRFLPRLPIQPRRLRKYKSAVDKHKLLALQLVKKNGPVIDYKNLILLKKCITDNGKILPKRINRITAKQQRSIARAVKNARIIGLLPFMGMSRKITDKKEVDKDFFLVKPKI